MPSAFYIWGNWSNTRIPSPFKSEKLANTIDDLKKLNIGKDFMIAQSKTGDCYVWGNGPCLGLGHNIETIDEPQKLEFVIPSDDGFSTTSVSIEQVSIGDRHCLFLTTTGDVFSVGFNDYGQLGLGHKNRSWKPTWIDSTVGFDSSKITQILAIKNHSFAVSTEGKLYSWGSNLNDELGLGPGHMARVILPEENTGFEGAFVQKIESSNDAGVFIVHIQEQTEDGVITGGTNLVGTITGDKTFDGLELMTSIAAGSTINRDEQVVLDVVSAMRKVIDLSMSWFVFAMALSYGEPGAIDRRLETDIFMNRYRASSLGKEGSDDDLKDVEFEKKVNLFTAELFDLERAENDIDQIINAARAQLTEVSNIPRAKNVIFVLTLFIDDMLLRRENISRTLSLRRIIDIKNKGLQIAPNKAIENSTSKILLHKISELKQLERELLAISVSDDIGSQVHSMTHALIVSQMSFVNSQLLLSNKINTKTTDLLIAPTILPSITLISHIFNDLQHFSVYNLYRNLDLNQYHQLDGSQMLATVTKLSDQKIDSIIDSLRNSDSFMRDSLIPSILYDMLVDIADLRKMCAAYQLRILLLHKGMLDIAKGV